MVGIGSWNAHGLSARGAWRQELEAEELDLWVISDLGSGRADFQLNGYSKLSKQRPDDAQGGGIAVFARHGLQYRIIETPADMEMLVVDIGTGVVFAAYIAPQHDQEEVARYLDVVESISATEMAGRKVMLIGDLNARLPGYPGPNARGRRLAQWIHENHLAARNSSAPTHEMGGILDLAITSIGTKCEVIVGQDTWDSDHRPIIAEWDIEADARELPTRRVWNKKKLRQISRKKWEERINPWLDENRPTITEINNQEDANHNWKQVEDWINTACKHFVGTQNVGGPAKPNRAGWWSDEIAAKIRTKTAAWERMQEEHSEENRAMYNQAKRMVKKAVKRARKKSWREGVEAVNEANQKEKWVILNKLRGSRSHMPAAVKAGNRMRHDPTTAFAEYYHSIGHMEVLTEDAKRELTAVELETPPMRNQSWVISEGEVQTTLKALGTTKAPGRDQIPNAFLRHARLGLAPTLTELFNRLAKAGMIPDEWRQGDIVVIPKNKEGDLNDMGNYRPITLLQTTRKVYESVLARRLDAIIETNKILSPMQHGFRRGRRTMQALETVMEIADEWKYKRKSGIIVFLDAEKAYDRASRPWIAAILRKTIGAYDGQLVGAILPMLEPSSRRVVGPQPSQQFEIKNGVAQGGTISPILFNLYQNEVQRRIEAASVAMKLDNQVVAAITYADDVALVAETPERANTLLRIADEAAARIGQKFNKRKCEWMAIGTQYKTARIHMGGQALKQVDGYKYLGIQITGELRMNNEHLIGRFQERAAEVCRRFRKGLTPRMASVLLLSLTRPLLEYGAEVLHVRQVMKLDGKLRKAMRIMLRLPPGTPNAIVEGEMRTPRMTERWLKLKCRYHVMETARPGSTLHKTRKVTWERRGTGDKRGWTHRNTQMVGEIAHIELIELEPNRETKVKQSLCRIEERFRAREEQIWRQEYKRLKTLTQYAEEADKHPLERARPWWRDPDGAWMLKGMARTYRLRAVLVERHLHHDPYCPRCLAEPQLETLEHLMLKHPIDILDARVANGLPQWFFTEDRQLSEITVQVIKRAIITRHEEVGIDPIQPTQQWEEMGGMDGMDDPLW